MNNIMDANIIRIFSFNQYKMPSRAFYRVGNVWEDGSFHHVSERNIKSLIGQCMEIGADVKTTVNEDGKIHVMLYVG